MTIACCLVLPEGVIFATDSTVSEGEEGRYHYLNHNQKIYEVGKESTLGVMTWGLSGLRHTSHRTIIAKAADQFSTNRPTNVRDAAQRFMTEAWQAFQAEFHDEIKEYDEIYERVSELARNESDKRSKEDDDRLKYLQDEIAVGYCIGGHIIPDRKPEAYHFTINPTLRSPPSIYMVDGELIVGQPEYFYRLYDGSGENVREKILKSGFWKGPASALDKILNEEIIVPPELNIRDGVDFAHFIVYSTIKTIKFSDRDQVCGGPIEIAVITTDREFRWVRHKTFDAAIEQ
jgi:hypothetical protein